MLRTEFIQYVTLLVSSPGTVTSPDSVVQPSYPGLTPSPNITPNISINDLGMNVSQQTKDKIINGEYVDLGILLTNYTTTDQLNNLSVGTNSQLMLQNKQPSKTLDIDTWIDVFLNFSYLCRCSFR